MSQQQQQQNLAILRSCFVLLLQEGGERLLTETLSQQQITPANLLVALRALSFVDDHLTQVELQSLIGAELLRRKRNAASGSLSSPETSVPSLRDDNSTVSVFEGTSAFEVNKDSKCVSFDVFCSVVRSFLSTQQELQQGNTTRGEDPVVVPSNAPDILSLYLSHHKHLQQCIQQLEKEEADHRREVLQQQADQQADMRSQLRRATHIASLRSRLHLTYARNRRVLEMETVDESRRKDTAQLRDLKHEAARAATGDDNVGTSKTRAQQQQQQQLQELLALENTVEATIEQVHTTRQSVEVVGKWFDTASALVMSEATTQRNTMIDTVSRRYEYTTSQLDRLEDKIAQVGQLLFAGSVTRFGRERHQQALRALYQKQRSEEQRAAQQEKLPATKFTARADAAAPPPARANFSWLEPTTTKPAAVAADTNDPLVHLFADVSNLSYCPGDAGLVQDLLTAKIEDVFLDFARLPEAPRTSLMSFRRLRHFVQRTCIDFPGSLAVYFLENADAVVDADAATTSPPQPPTRHRDAYSSPVGMVAGAGDETENELSARGAAGIPQLDRAAWTLRPFTTFLEEVSQRLYRNLVPFVSTNYLVELFLDREVIPRMHFTTVRKALSPQTAAEKSSQQRLLSVEQRAPVATPSVASAESYSFHALTLLNELLSAFSHGANNELESWLCGAANGYTSVARVYPARAPTESNLNAPAILEAILRGSSSSSSLRLRATSTSDTRSISDLLAREDAAPLRNVLLATKHAVHQRDASLDALAGYLHYLLADAKRLDTILSQSTEFDSVFSSQQRYHDETGSSGSNATLTRAVLEQRLIYFVTRIYSESFIFGPSAEPLSIHSTFDLLWGSSSTARKSCSNEHESATDDDAENTAVEQRGVPFIILVLACVAIVREHPVPPLAAYLRALMAAGAAQSA